MAKGELTTVTFNVDIYPYVFGDVVRLTDSGLAAVDATAKRRGVEKPYTKGVATPDVNDINTPTGDSEAELARMRADSEPEPDENAKADKPKSSKSRRSPANKTADSEPEPDTASEPTGSEPTSDEPGDGSEPTDPGDPQSPGE